MLPYDKERATALAKLFTAQELDYITEWIMTRDATTNQNESRLEDIIWEAYHQAVENI